MLKQKNKIKDKTKPIPGKNNRKYNLKERRLARAIFLSKHMEKLVSVLKMLFLERPACKRGTQVWKLGFWWGWGVPMTPRSDKSWSLYLSVYTNNAVYANYLLSIWDYDMLVCARQKEKVTSPQ